MKEVCTCVIEEKDLEQWWGSVTVLYDNMCGGILVIVMVFTALGDVYRNIDCINYVKGKGIPLSGVASQYLCMYM